MTCCCNSNPAQYERNRRFGHLVYVLGRTADGAKLPSEGLRLNASKSESHLNMQRYSRHPKIFIKVPIKKKFFFFSRERYLSSPSHHSKKNFHQSPHKKKIFFFLRERYLSSPSHHSKKNFHQSPHKKKIFFFYGNDTLARRLITAKKIFIKVPIKKKFFFFTGTIP
jgi:hypothetical protein